VFCSPADLHQGPVDAWWSVAASSAGDGRRSPAPARAEGDSTDKRKRSDRWGGGLGALPAGLVPADAAAQRCTGPRLRKAAGSGSAETAVDAGPQVLCDGGRRLVLFRPAQMSSAFPGREAVTGRMGARQSPTPPHGDGCAPTSPQPHHRRCVERKTPTLRRKNPAAPGLLNRATKRSGGRAKIGLADVLYAAHIPQTLLQGLPIALAMSRLGAQPGPLETSTKSSRNTGLRWRTTRRRRRSQDSHVAGRPDTRPTAQNGKWPIAEP